MCVSVRWVQKTWAGHKAHAAGQISHPAPMGGPLQGMPGRREHSAVPPARQAEHAGAVALQRIMASQTGMNIPHGAIHAVLKDENMAETHPKKAKRRKCVRYEREHSNSLRRADWKLLDDGGRFPCCEDDASRFVTGYGAFEGAATENALAVLERAVADHGKPASTMADHGAQFYANERATAAGRGESAFERRLVELGIRQILAGAGHPQTNGKLERLRGEIQRKLPEFEAIMMRKSDPVDLFMR